MAPGLLRLVLPGRFPGWLWVMTDGWEVEVRPEWRALRTSPAQCQSGFGRVQAVLSLAEPSGDKTSRSPPPHSPPPSELGCRRGRQSSRRLSRPRAPDCHACLSKEDLDSSAAAIVEARDLRQLTDPVEIEALCRSIVHDPKHAEQVSRGG